ncbi:MAG: response regulator [Proteobacteria bacterium]|jgi:adenylate cyclase|uniref:adenylate/guanylate cyclase domain-containing protein n=1 Tax=Roseateles sp. TaxID=1971397 RepID=UPI000F92B17D|nr:adenylate/guanylate cyclase domain-containing response regulator [Methylibium sp.]MCH8854827.1 response regulator [Pseudomonadota bacterium]RTL19352.1 MAG: adenylate/guanylate cyclase domain-containing response regulator [Burkholderiales bacterium]|mmetsp:Transcript_70438/g.165883  ORF Transcript_70438/g.165883 Transcript_70438/m.165883 type:complete len:348 (+) Transcript_70438:1222-2265(+)
MRERRAGTARVLLADDNRVNRLLLARHVELLGHQVEMVEDGLAALERAQQQAFDLVLMDIDMPGLNGFELLERLREHPELRELPVIVTSALEGMDGVVRCIELGAEDYLRKPVNLVLLKARIGAALERKRLRDQQRELVRRFATREVAQDLEAEGFALGGRRAQATVMFCDIRGFTSLVESQPPEDIIELLNTYYTLMFAAINEHGGVVNQMIGDGLMAVFGAPKPLQAPGRCALLAAAEMVEMVAQFSEEQRALGKPEVRIGVGVASGDVVAGYTGTRSRATYTCIGDTVNVAARLEAHTKLAGHAVLFDAATREQLGDALPSLALGPVQFKGKRSEVDVFALSSS